MDDILILAPTRWRLRGAVKVVNQTPGMLSLEKPDKAFIGRIERGFDFLGYHFSPAGLSVAKPPASAADHFTCFRSNLIPRDPVGDAVND